MHKDDADLAELRDLLAAALADLAALGEQDLLHAAEVRRICRQVIELRRQGRDLAADVADLRRERDTWRFVALISIAARKTDMRGHRPDYRDRTVRLRRRSLARSRCWRCARLQARRARPYCRRCRLDVRGHD